MGVTISFRKAFRFCCGGKSELLEHCREDKEKLDFRRRPSGMISLGQFCRGLAEEAFQIAYVGMQPGGITAQTNLRLFCLI